MGGSSSNTKTLIRKPNYKVKPHTNIMLVGDSVLDNFYWLIEPKNDLRQQLENMCVQESKFIILLSTRQKLLISYLECFQTLCIKKQEKNIALKATQ